MAIKMAESLRYGYYVLSVGEMCIFLNYYIPVFTRYRHSVPGRQVVKINTCTTMYDDFPVVKRIFKNDYVKLICNCTQFT